MQPTVFVSYRRSDTRHVAGRLADRLSNDLGSRHVFIDVDTVPAGANFRVVIGEAVRTCSVLIALIGPSWMTAADAFGRRRIDDPDDIVGLEITIAMVNSIHVIPVLVDGAPMPDRSDLPSHLQALASRNAVRLDHETFHSDAIRVVRAVQQAAAAHEATEVADDNSDRVDTKPARPNASHGSPTSLGRLASNWRDHRGRVVVTAAICGVVILTTIITLVTRDTGMVSVGGAAASPTLSTPTVNTAAAPVAPADIDTPQSITSAFGQRITLPDGVAVSVSEPKTFELSPTAATLQKPSARYVRMTVTITNGSGKSLQTIGTVVRATANGTPAVLAFDAEIGGSPNSTVLPGKAVTFPVAFGLPSKDRVEFQVEVVPRVEFVNEPAIFIGNV